MVGSCVQHILCLPVSLLPFLAFPLLLCFLPSFYFFLIVSFLPTFLFFSDTFPLNSSSLFFSSTSPFHFPFHLLLHSLLLSHSASLSSSPSPFSYFALSLLTSLSTLLSPFLCVSFLPPFLFFTSLPTLLSPASPPLIPFSSHFPCHSLFPFLPRPPFPLPPSVPPYWPRGRQGACFPAGLRGSKKMSLNRPRRVQQVSSWSFRRENVRRRRRGDLAWRGEDKERINTKRGSTKQITIYKPGV